MIYKFFTSTYVLIIVSFFSYSQETNDFLEILSSDHILVVKERKIDSLFSNSIRFLPALEVADYYHAYGLWFFKKWKNHEDELFLNKAIIYTDKSKEIKKSIANIDIEILNKTIYNLGVFNFKGNHFFEAVKNYSEVIKNYSKINNVNKRKKKLISSYMALGKSYIEIGDYHKALYNTAKGIELSNSNNFDRTNSINGYIQLANTYALMGYKKYSKKIQINLKKADSIRALASFNTIDHKNRIDQLEGNRLLMSGYYIKAINPFLNVLKGLAINDSLSIAQVHNSLGFSHLLLENYDDALLNLQAAISYNPKLTLSYENLGDLYIAKERFVEALLEYEKAISCTVSYSKEIKYDDLISQEELKIAVNKYYLLGHLIQKAKGWVKYYHFDNNQNHLLKALETFKMADQLVDIIRFESTEYKSKLFWREKGAALYMKAVETCYLLQKPEEAYYFMEKNKALLLLEDITNEQAKENTKLPDHIAKQEYEFKQRIYLFENELNIYNNQSKDTIRQLKDKIYKQKRIYEKFVDSIAHAYPEYAENKKKIKVLPYTKFKANYISNQEIVLQYILNKNQGYGLLTTTNESVFFEIDDVVGLQKNILNLGKQSSQWFKNKEQLTAYHTNANSIFKQILPQQVYEHCIGKKLTILPDYTLQNISFDALTTSTKHHSYFINDAEIRYAYSMSYLDSKTQIKYTPEYPFIGFAPVTFPKQELGDLTISKEEVISISDLFKGSVLIGENATTSNFRDTINQFKVIHLSTHADISNIENPWIAFRDKKLSLKEIYATKNQSDMVVLSACKTSLGEVKEGEGVMSLARGFFYSGAKSVVSSLWSANDKSNQELMVEFYKGLDQGLVKSTALRNAKLNYINTHQGSELSPFYWGSLILIGDNTPISLSQNLFGWYWFIGLFVIGCISVSIFNVRKKRR